MNEKPTLISTLVMLKVYAFNNYEAVQVPLLHQERDPEAFKDEPNIFAIQWYDNVLRYIDHAGIELTLRSDPVNISPVYYLDPIEIVDDLLRGQSRWFDDFMLWKERGVPMKWKIATNLFVGRKLHFGPEDSLFQYKIKEVPY